MTRKGPRFGRRAPGGVPRVPITFRVVPSSRRLLEEAAAASGVDLSALLRRYAVEGLQRDGFMRAPGAGPTR